MGVQSLLRVRAEALMQGTAGAAPLVFTAGRFTLCVPDRTPETSEVVERVFDVAFDPETILDRRPLTTAVIAQQVMRVAVAYIVTGAGDGGDWVGQQSGPGDLNAVEDRAAQDAHEMAAVIGAQGNWTGISSDVDVIDCEPAPDAPLGTVTLAEGRLIRETTFTLTYRAGSPGSLGPSTP